MDEKLRHDGLQLALTESNRINAESNKITKKLEQQMVVGNMLLTTGFVIFILVLIFLFLYIDQNDLLYYVSGR